MFGRELRPVFRGGMVRPGLDQGENVMSRVKEARAAVTEAQREVERRQKALALRICEEVTVNGRSQVSVAREIGVSPARVHELLRSVTSAPRA